MRGEPACVLLGRSRRAAGSGDVAGDFEFVEAQHLLAKIFKHRARTGRGVRTEFNKNVTHAREGAYLRRATARKAAAGLPQCKNHGRTASLISPLRAFMRSKACGKSARRFSSVTKSCAEISPRRTASNASRMKRGVWWNGEMILISE